jgi:hypothetical protein
MYEVNGRQYLVVNAGQSLADAQSESGGEAPPPAAAAPAATAPSRAYVAFALPAP